METLIKEMKSKLVVGSINYSFFETWFEPELRRIMAENETLKERDNFYKSLVSENIDLTNELDLTKKAYSLEVNQLLNELGRESK